MRIIRARVYAGKDGSNYSSRVPRVQAVLQARARARSGAGFAAAQFNLGYKFEKGQGVAQDTAEAIRWYRLAAAQGDAVATAALKQLGA